MVHNKLYPFLLLILFFQAACAHTFLVTKVIDADTFQLNNSITVRLIGIDAPELHWSQKLERDLTKSGQSKAQIQVLGQEASDFTAALVLGKRVFLEYGKRRQDRYQRTLAYVYLADQKKSHFDSFDKFRNSVNFQLIQAGFARVYNAFPFKYKKDFQEAETSAKEHRVGIWRHGTIP